VDLANLIKVATATAKARTVVSTHQWEVLASQTTVTPLDKWVALVSKITLKAWAALVSKRMANLWVDSAAEI
jgi:hypothetical protein